MRAQLGHLTTNATEQRTEKAEVNSHVPPPVRESDVERQEKLIADLQFVQYKRTGSLAHVTYLILAVPTCSGITRVVKVATGSIHEIVCPGSARLARWRCEHRKFFGPTRYLETTARHLSDESRDTELHDHILELCRQNRAYHAGEGVQLVQPGSPERVERGVRDCHSAHVTQNDLYWRYEECRDLDTWRD